MKKMNPCGGGPVEVFTAGRQDLDSIPESVWEDILFIAGRFAKNCCQSIDNYVCKDFEIL